MHHASRVQARIKQLCCLGIGGEALMPALFQELHALIPSYANQFMWADENYQLSNLYGEVPEVAAIGPLYVQEFYNSREKEVVASFTTQVRELHGVRSRDQSIIVDPRRFYRSDCYNQIFRPLGYDDYLCLTVREHDKAPGLIAVFRRPNEAPFTAEDARRLGALQPFLAHALTRKDNTDVTLVESGETGLIIADAAGKPVYLSDRGRRLLFLATNPQVAPGRVVPQHNTLPPPLQRICRSLVAVFSGMEPTHAPVHRHVNGWGGFTFRAYRLNEAEGAAILVGITVAREEPLPIRLLRAAERLPLTQRQTQICLLMAEGLSQPAIAERLGISVHTVVAHARAIYASLGVSTRAELINRLLAAPTQGPALAH